MTGEIIKIHDPKVGRNGKTFIRVEFRMEGGSWAKTDLCPEFGNFRRWNDVMDVGVELDGLRMRSPDTVDADSRIEVIYGV